MSIWIEGKPLLREHYTKEELKIFPTAPYIDEELNELEEITE